SPAAPAHSTSRYTMFRLSEPTSPWRSCSGPLRREPWVPAVITSFVATMVAWIGLGDAPQFTTHDLELSPSLIAWSIVAGPVFGLAAYGFRTLTRAATAHTPRGWHRVSWCLAAFFGIGLLATLFPQLPGNGKGPSQLGF